MESSGPSKPSAALASTSRRERQIMDIIYRRGAATAAEVRAEMDDAPTYTTVRGLLRILAAKGHVEIGRDGARYVYRPTLPTRSAGETMLSHVVETFFGGSAAQAMSALLGGSEIRLGKEEINTLQRLIDQHEAKEEKP
jgi:predicted transcriptional regulator